MKTMDLLLPALEHFRIPGYWLILLVCMADAIAFAGIAVPGSIIVVFAGFLSSRGFFDMGDLIWFAAIGAMMGDGISFYLGRKGTRFFNPESRIFKSALYKRGVQYFGKKGGVSILLARFIGPLRPFIPFIAGISAMNPGRYLPWNILGAFLWAIFYLSLGYFFGRTWQVIEIWTTRAGLAAGIFILLFSVVYFAKVFVSRYGRQIFSLLADISRAVREAFWKNEGVRVFVRKHPGLVMFVRKRLDRTRFTGMPVTLLIITFIYVLSLLLGLIGDLLMADPVVAADIRIENLISVFRHPTTIRVFLWITLLGRSWVILFFAISASVLFRIWGKGSYILPLWGAIAGSQLFTQVGKLAFHRPRPDVAFYLENTFSFPSGHASVAVAFYGFITYFLVRNIHGWNRKVNLFFGGSLIIFAIGLSRLYLGVHYLSDVLAGYLLGMLWLIAAVSFQEWEERSEKKEQRALPQTDPSLVKVITGVILVSQLIFYGIYGMGYKPVEMVHQTPLVQVAGPDIASLFQEGKLPAHTESLTGSPQEPISMILLVNNSQEVIDIFKKSGWFMADEVSFSSLSRAARAAILNRGYNNAPMTPSFWNGKVHEFGFQKPTEEVSIRKRHHCRVWGTGMKSDEGQDLFVMTVSFDSGIKWAVTHRIGPDLDTERELLFSDLEKSGSVKHFSIVQLSSPGLGKNFAGDPFFSDGKAYIVELSDNFRTEDHLLYEALAIQFSSLSK